MIRSKAVAIGLGGAALLAAFLAAGPAGADAVSPPGSCVGSGRWERGGFTETSTQHQESDVIKVPRADTVMWAGNEQGFALGSQGPRRQINGEVDLTLPPPFGQVKIESWGGSSVRYANTGEHAYDLPGVLVGVKLQLSGFHQDGGRTTCSGSVFVEVTGSALSNPLTYGGLGLLVVSGGMLFFAGRPVFRKLWAFEDTNPG